MDTNKIDQKKNHSFCLENRSSISMTGISEVISSCDTEISLVSSYGEITVTGKDLKINKFNVEDGALIAEGNVDCVKYKGAKTPLLKRIFK